MAQEAVCNDECKLHFKYKWRRYAN